MRHWREFRLTLLLTLTAALAGAALLAGCAPKAARAEGPKKPALPAVIVTVAGDTVTVGATVRSSVAVDSIHVVVALPGSGKPYANKKVYNVAPNTPYTVSVVWPGIAPGTYSGTVTARSYRGNCATLSKCQSAAASKAFTVTVDQDAPPPPAIDSVEVSALRLLPDTVTVARGFTALFCLAAEFPNGGVGLWGEHEDNPVCRDRLAAAYPGRRPLTDAESAYLFASENCYPTDGQNPGNGTVCKRRGTPS